MKKVDKKDSKSVDDDLKDLDELEKDLNSLSDNLKKDDTKSNLNVSFGDSTKINLNSFDSNVKSETNKPTIGHVGSATASSMKDKKTWDGFGKFNNVPINNKGKTEPTLSKEEELEKFKYLKKLEKLERRGVTLSQKYTMDSKLDEMKGEYELIVSEKQKKDSIKFQCRMLMACITGLEFLNNKFDPFDLKLDGWAEQVDENIDEYDEIFANLRKYKSKAKMAPELGIISIRVLL